VHSSAVHNAARVSSFTCAGCLVSSADTDADDKCSPDRSASSRRSCAPVQTSRCAAASRNCHLICITISFQPGQGARDRTAVRVSMNVADGVT